MRLLSRATAMIACGTFLSLLPIHVLLAQSELNRKVTGRIHYLIQNLDRKRVEQRGTAGDAGVAFDRLNVSPDTRYRIWLLEDATLRVAELTFKSLSSGRSYKLPDFNFRQGTGPDSDKDGLQDLGEFIIGSDPSQPDTDGDGIPDGAEVRQGTDPLSGKSVRTGIIASAPVDGTAVDLCVVNDMAIVAASERGVAVFNVFNGLNPTVIAQVDTPGTALRVACADNRIAVADGDAGLALIDISDPPAASILRQIQFGTQARAVAAAGGLAFVGLNSGQVVMVDITSGAELGRVDLGSAVEDLAIAGDHLHACTRDQLHTISLLDGEFILAGSVPSPIVSLGSRRISVGGGVVHVVHASGYNTFDISIPTLPRLIKAGRTPQFGWKQLALNGSGLAVAAVDQNSTLDGPNDVSLYITSDPLVTDNFVTTFATPGLARSVAIYNGLAYVADSPAGLQVVNYLAYDNKGRPPAIQLKASFSLKPGRVEEGKRVWLEAQVTDDLQVRNVEFFVDGSRVGTDGSFPFEQQFISPRRNGGKSSFVVRARASDTGGNTTWSEEYIVELMGDATPPRIRKTIPAPNSISGSVDLILANLSEPIQESSLSTASFKLVSPGVDGLFGTTDDLPVNGGSLSFRESALAVMLQFPSALTPGNYQATISAPLADRAGNTVLIPHQWSFRVFDRADADRDGIPDELESSLGLNPLNADTNGNGVRDGDEDFDRDGLTNAEEFVMGTDPKNPRSVNVGQLDGQVDRDGDALPDGRELRVGSNPLAQDTDNDGWNDEAEVTAGSSPVDARSRPSMVVVAPVVRTQLPRYLPGNQGGIFVAGPTVQVGLPSVAGDLAGGLYVGAPALRIGLPATGESVTPGVHVAAPALKIGLNSLISENLQGLHTAQPPLKISIKP